MSAPITPPPARPSLRDALDTLYVCDVVLKSGKTGQRASGKA